MDQTTLLEGFQIYGINGREADTELGRVKVTRRVSWPTQRGLRKRVSKIEKRAISVQHTNATSYNSMFNRLSENFSQSCSTVAKKKTYA